MRTANYFQVATLLTVTIISCAKVVAPPGGPEDKESPTILSASPQNLSTNLGAESKLTIFFSEPLANTGLEKRIFISPRQLDEPSIKVKGSRLVIELADTLLENQTYVVTLSSEIADLRGNKLGESRSFAFTRGDHIDTGVVAGVVTDRDLGVQGISVALYRDFVPATIGDMDSLAPSYFTTSGDKGVFKFEYLPPSQYFLLAFKDNNKDQLFLYGVNSFALGTREVDLTITNSLNEELRIQHIDTSAVSLLSVTNSDNQLVKISLTRSLANTVTQNNTDKIHFRNLADTTKSIPVNGIISLSGAMSAKYGLFLKSLDSGSYSCSIAFDSFNVDGRNWKSELVTPFHYIPQNDTTAPVINNSTTPRNYAPWQTALWHFEFNEPVKIDTSVSSSTFVTFGNGVSVRSAIVQPNPFTIDCIITEKLMSGEDYTVNIPQSAVTDISGNSMFDSVLFGTHTVWPDDSLGSLTFAVERTDIDSLQDSIDSASMEYVITFRRLPSETYELTTVIIDSMEISLPAGDYVIEVRPHSEVSRAEDRRFDGSLYPLRWADSRSFYPDTVRVRPRFDSDKITIILE
ncbi:Ig-like domain-containing protein [bacterium AH-315-F03]|nr:Ig-like domain-containing protein [bacterium AH-315-F03]